MQQLRVEYLQPPEPIDDQVDARVLRRRGLQALALLVVLGLIAWLAPGLGDVRSRLRGADGGWLALAVALEGLSCVSYVVMFRPIFCDRMTWRSATELGLSELAVGSLLPASGAGGLALGAWALRKSGMPALQIAERSVAFFTLKSAANFVAVAVLGVLMFAGVGPSRSPLLTLVPAFLAVASIAAVVWLPRLLRQPERGTAGGPRRQAFATFLAAAGDGLREAGHVLRRGDPLVIVGSLGYWFFDNAVLWAAFHAVGASPPVTVVLMAYLLGQLGGLLPIPGGVGGIDGGLIGTFVVFGVAAAPTTAAVLAYRLILFWLPLLAGAVAFRGLRRGFDDPRRPDLCGPIPAPAP
jgi:glycosyltransferase 2 family protein